MALQKLICTQCGSNELELFGRAAYKCESCGTILKEEKPKEVPQPPPVQPKKEKPFRSRRIQHGLEDGPDFSHDSTDHYSEHGNQFIKMIFWIGIVGGIAALVGWLLMM
jgi:transcription initiation factor TFIIIB Brf1 subunit/transcription initiation factor TFIIB